MTEQVGVIYAVGVDPGETNMGIALVRLVPEPALIVAETVRPNLGCTTYTKMGIPEHVMLRVAKMAMEKLMLAMECDTWKLTKGLKQIPTTVLAGVESQFNIVTPGKLVLRAGAGAAIAAAIAGGMRANVYLERRNTALQLVGLSNKLIAKKGQTKKKLYNNLANWPLNASFQDHASDALLFAIAACHHNGVRLAYDKLRPPLYRTVEDLHSEVRASREEENSAASSSSRTSAEQESETQSESPTHSSE